MSKIFSILLIFTFFALNIQAESTTFSDSTITSSTTKNKLNLVLPPLFNKLLVKLSSSEQEAKAGTYHPFTNLQFSGYTRLFVQYRNMNSIYPGMPANAKQNLLVNGYEINGQQADGYQEPFCLLRLEGKPSSKTHFKVEYAMDNQMDGVAKDTSGKPINGTKQTYSRRISVYRILQFEAEAISKAGTFKLTAGGGVNWYRMSPFTLWNYEYRDDMFERYPWEPEGHSYNRYTNFYAAQNVARDSRWGNTGTQGFILEAKNLPKGFGAVVLYGKTDNSGGFQTYKYNTPKNMAAFRIDKGLGSQKIGINYFSQFGYFNSAAQYKINQEIITGDVRLNFDNIKAFAEFGAGRYVESGLLTSSDYFNYFGHGVSHDTSVSYKNNWAPAISIQTDFGKKITFIPLTLQVYYIDKSVVNVNSQVMNTANSHAQGSPANVNSPYDVSTIRGAVTDIGQMANNRMGVSLKHEDTYRKLKISLAISTSQEIQNLYALYSSAPYNAPNNTATFGGYAQSFNSISFQHRANQFTRSRFGYFRNDLGPYNRLINMYRRSFETIEITDTGAVAKSYKKGFSSIDFCWKYKVTLFKKDLLISNYYNYSSVQDHISVIPEFTKDAFLRYFYQEVNLFYPILPKVTVIGFFSCEKALGNNRTALADSSGNLITNPVTGIPVYNKNGKPIDQFGTGYGIGLDYDFASRAGLYVRYRWFDHKDKNFTKDHFNGQEVSVEFKVFF